VAALRHMAMTQIVTSLDEFRETVRFDRSDPRILVPTMGALHDGHASLLKRGNELKGKSGFLIATIFVNPTQFGPSEDFDSYPRTFEEDLKICSDHGVDLVFAPSTEDMYPGEPSTSVHESSLSLGLCGGSRPGHFDGVCTIVLKLLMLTTPHIAIFGKKDYQQLAVIRRMVRDLNLPIDIQGGETVREKDGLALSSRNAYLSESLREQAPAIRRGLLEAQKLHAEGERDATTLRAAVRHLLADGAPDNRIDYLEVVDPDSLEPFGETGVGEQAVIAAAVFFGKTRLIDNIELGG